MTARQKKLIAGAESSSTKIQSNVEPYTAYVLSSLVGIKGRNTSDVLSFIVKAWIGEHQQDLDICGISVPDWRKKADGRKEGAEPKKRHP